MISTLTKTLQDPYYSPVEKHVRSVANELAKRGHEIWVAALKGTQPEEFKVVEVEGEEEKAFQIYKNMLNQFDVVMDFSTMKHTYVYKHDEMPALKLLGPCYPYQAISYHMAPPIPHPCFIATSDAMAQVMSAKLGCAFHVVYYFSSPKPVDLELKERTDHLLFLGRFEKGKGAQIAVDLARQLGRPIDVAGEDLAISDQRFTILLLQKADGRLIRVFGRVNEQMKHEMLAKAKVVVLPYLEESMAWTGQVALEAFEHGTPIVGLKKGCLKEIVKQGVNGLLCERIEELPQCMHEIDLIKPEGCLKTAKEFCLETTVSKYEDLLKRVLDGYEW